MAPRGGLEQLSAAEFAASVLHGNVETGQGKGTGHEAALETAAGDPAPEAPGETLLVLFDRGSPEDRRLERVLAQGVVVHRGRLRAVQVSVAGLQDQFERWQSQRHAYDTYDFGRWPAVGVFRGGRLITTFHPRSVFRDARLQEREELEQLQIFVSKMVDYDPAQVKEQKNF